MKTILIALILLLIITLIISFNKKEGFIPEELDKLTYYDENNNIIDHKNIERDEQEMAYEYIEPDDVVLELGGRYGTVSNVINHKLNNKTHHVVIEPDSIVIPALTKNKQQFQYYIENSYISNKNKKIVGDGYGKMMIDSDETNNKITYSEFKEKYPLKFNVIVADCEGCLPEFLDIMGDDLNNIKKIIFEADQPDMCDYNELIKKLISIGFEEKEKKFKDIHRYVYIKK
uniref:Methyltransferase FkbM domain-containing protein n=1 Tax=viral metagenome TaxID=1070528 RepID=A0A6C0JIK4_9ZZZZ